MNETGSNGAYTSIQTAIDAANPGDTIFVYSGTYAQDLEIGKSLTLIGENKATTTVVGSGTIVRITADSVDISGFTLSGGLSMYFQYSGNHRIDNNIFLNNRGIHCQYSYNNNITNNSFVNCGIGMWGEEMAHFCSNVIINNSVNGEPLFYFRDTYGLDIDGIPAGQVILANCNDSSVKNLQIDVAENGISVFYSRNINVSGNNISSIGNFDYGIYVIHTEYSNFTNNNVSGYLDGIKLHRTSRYNNFTANNVSFNDQMGFFICDSSFNELYQNIVIGNKRGVGFDNGDNNNLSRNIVANNWMSGFFIYPDSEGNLIYHNNIIDNADQADDLTSGGNQWDNGYPSGGNYWTDYNGIDRNSTPSQDVPPYDGIGDTPYEIDSTSYDNYPLMEPIPDTVPPRIKLLSPSNNSIIKPGETLDFSVYDGNLDYANYSVDGGPQQPFTHPYNISTDIWPMAHTQ